ncbi:aldolase [Streptosporangiaceae bacterium NEAU-GS5]|nr:aldolase [Streptosporangiaceae bacterium NEAU-GS5]
MKLTLGQTAVAGFAEAYQEQGERFAEGQPAWQPIHTVYVPADRLTPGTVTEWGGEALRLAEAYLEPGPLRERVVAKLRREPIEDLRIDFEDGYGRRPDREDADTERAAESVAAMHAAGTLPRRWGLRVKSFADGDPQRSLRTLDGLLTGVSSRVGRLPDGFTVTFPKVLMEAYLGQFAGCLEALEGGLALPYGTLRFEMQVEATQTVAFLRPGLVEVCRGRLAAAHFGVFDYTASCGLPPHEQRLDHPACDHARHVMQVAFAGTGVELSDGSLAAAPASDSAEDVRALWARHAELVRHSLTHGFYQGWDMHPSHLVSRFATVYAFHLERYDAYRERVDAWRDQRQVGGVMDEPATVKTLAAALRRADQALVGVEEGAPGTDVR